MLNFAGGGGECWGFGHLSGVSEAASTSWRGGASPRAVQLLGHRPGLCYGASGVGFCDRLPGASAVSQALAGHVKPEAHVLARWSACARQIQRVQDVLDSLHAHCQAVRRMCTDFRPGKLVRKRGSPLPGIYLPPVPLTNGRWLYGSPWERGMCPVPSFETGLWVGGVTRQPQGQSDFPEL